MNKQLGQPNRAARREAARQAPHLHADARGGPTGTVTLSALTARILLDMLITPEVNALLVGSQAKLQAGLAQQELERGLAALQPPEETAVEPTDVEDPQAVQDAE